MLKSFCLVALGLAQAEGQIHVGHWTLSLPALLRPDAAVMESAVGNGRKRVNPSLQKEAEAELIFLLEQRENANLLPERELLEIRSLLKRGLPPLVANKPEESATEGEPLPTREFIQRVFEQALTEAEKQGRVTPGAARNLPTRLQLGPNRRSGARRIG